MLITGLILFGNILMRMVGVILPSWSIGNGFYDQTRTLINYAMGFNNVFPIAEMFWAILIILGFEIALLCFRFLVGMLSIIRGGGGIDI